MIVFILIYGVVKVLVAAVVVFQLLSNLIVAKSNQQLLSFSDNLATYVYQILQFLMFSSEEKPFPFGEWPGEGKKQMTTKRKRRSTKNKKNQAPKDEADAKTPPSEPDGEREEDQESKS